MGKKEGTKEQKYAKIKEKARLLEETAKRKEQMMAIGDGGQIESKGEVNDMIVESIKAKLAILDDN